MKSRVIICIAAWWMALTMPLSSMMAEESMAMPTRLHFVNAVDANVYTERLVYEVFKRLDIDVSIIITEMETGLKGIHAGVYDGICNQSDGVEMIFDQLIAVPFTTGTSKFYAITLQGDTSTYSSWEDLRGKRVGSLIGKTKIIRNLPDGVISHIERQSMSTLYNSLRNGECDVAVITDISEKPIEKLVLPSDLRAAGILATYDCHMYLNRQYAPLVDRIAEVLQAMEEDGSLARLKGLKPVEDREEKVVLYLSSYSSEMEWEQRLLEGVGNVLNQYKDIIYHNIALNSYRDTNAARWENTALAAISADFVHSSPDAVIVSDNEAMSFLLSNYNIILSNDVPIIACGLNNTELVTSHRFDMNPNMTGILETISAAKTVEEMLRLFPQTREIYVINDYSLTGTRWRTEIQNQLAPFADRVSITYSENISAGELIAHVAGLGEHSLVLCGSYFLDNESHYFPQATIQAMLYDASPVPIFGLLDSIAPLNKPCVR